jgi:hypothetical protein
MNQEYLKQVLYYNQITGSFTWLSHPSFSCKNSTRADLSRPDGYRLVSINYENYYAHRLAFLYMTGEIPPIVDHIDRNPDNNRWVNLRACSSSENHCNSAIPRHNSSGLKNISDNSKKSSTRPWRVTMQFGDTNIDKTFATLEEATEYAEAIRVKLHKDFAFNGQE